MSPGFDPVSTAAAASGEGPTSIVVVSNRLPVTWSDREGWTRSPGGLVTALEGVARRRSVTWVGHLGPGAGSGVAPRWHSGELRAVSVDDSLMVAAVDGLANSALWPALHGLESRVRWRDHWWEAFVEYNRIFAASVADIAPPNALIWIHDFQLMLVPRMLRGIRPNLRIGFSSHTPVDVGVLESLPAAQELAAGVFAADCIGTQRDQDRDALVEFQRRWRPTDARLQHRSPTETTRVFTSPVSIDPVATMALLAEPVTEALVRRERTLTAGRRLIVSIDRLDYTKGVLPRLEAFDLAFRKGWLTPEDVRIVQVVQPTRSRLDDYRALQLETERRAHELRTRWLRADGSSPFEIIVGSLDRRHVAALLALGDVCVVTPPRDGMNLVAKEFCVLNTSTGGVLVLSSGAGAWDALGPACVTVDEMRPAAIARALHEALEMPEDERRRSANRRAAIVNDWTSLDWAEDFLARLSDESTRLTEGIPAAT